MNKSNIALVIVLICVAGISYQFLKPTSLDFSKDEAPFSQMKMPPKLVRAGSYMDGGSVLVEIVDQTNHQYFITFPFDYQGIRTAHPDAFEGKIIDSSKPLKNPARAKAICIQLIKDYAVPYTANNADIADLNEIPLCALRNPPQAVASRIFKKIEDTLRPH